MPRDHRFATEGFSVVRVENVDEVANLRADLIAVYRPVNSQELFAIERVALAQHSLVRSYRLEAGFLNCALEEGLQLPADPRILSAPELRRGPVALAQDHNFWMAFGLREMNRNRNDWPQFLRYQAQAERLYRRAIEELERLRALREVLPETDLTETGPDPAKGHPPEAQPSEAKPDPQPAAEPLMVASSHRRPPRHPFKRRGVLANSQKPKSQSLPSP